MFHPAAFPRIKPDQAKAVLIDYYPDEMRAAGYTFGAARSQKLRERAFCEQNEGRFL